MSPNGDLERAKQRMQLVEHEMRDGGLERVDQHRAMLAREMRASRKRTLLWLVLLLVILLAIGLLVVWHP